MVKPSDDLIWQRHTCYCDQDLVLMQQLSLFSLRVFITLDPATVATLYLVSIFVPDPFALLTAQFTLQLCRFSDDDVAVGKAGVKVNPWI